MYKKNLRLVIKYLKGEINIYDGKHDDVIKTWDNSWDEMVWMGYNPETAAGIQRYINENL